MRVHEYSNYNDRTVARAWPFVDRRSCRDEYSWNDICKQKFHVSPCNFKRHVNNFSIQMIENVTNVCFDYAFLGKILEDI